MSLGLSLSYYSRYLLRGASVMMIPTTQSDPGKETEDLRLGIIALTSYIKLRSRLMAGTVFAEGVLRFRKWLVSKFLLSRRYYCGSRTQSL